jgi:hypothetical protein
MPAAFFLLTILDNHPAVEIRTLQCYSTSSVGSCFAIPSENFNISNIGDFLNNLIQSRFLNQHNMTSILFQLDNNNWKLHSIPQIYTQYTKIPSRPVLRTELLDIHLTEGLQDAFELSNDILSLEISGIKSPDSSEEIPGEDLYYLKQIFSIIRSMNEDPTALKHCPGQKTQKFAASTRKRRDYFRKLQKIYN